MAIRITSIRGIKTPHTDILPSQMNSFLAFGKTYTSGINYATDKLIIVTTTDGASILANKDLGINLVLGSYWSGQTPPFYYPYLFLSGGANTRHFDLSLKENCSFSGDYDGVNNKWHLSVYVNGTDGTDVDNLRLRKNSDGTTELGLWLGSAERAYFKSDGTIRFNTSVLALSNTAITASKPLVFSGLGATDIAIDLSVSGLGSSGYLLYHSSSRFWRVDGYLTTTSVRASSYMETPKINTTSASLNLEGRGVDSATAIALKLYNLNALATEGARIAVFYSDNLITERCAIDKNGAIYPTLQGDALPTASATYRNALWVVRGGIGVADKLYVCLKSATDTYSWVLIATG